MLSNDDLSELVRRKEIEPHMEVAARFRRATANTRSDPASVEYREIAAREARAKAEVEAMRADMAKTQAEIKTLEERIALKRGGL